MVETTFEERLSLYEVLLAQSEQRMLDDGKEKYAKLIHVCRAGIVDADHWNPILKIIAEKDGDSDFNMLPLIRVLYQTPLEGDQTAIENLKRRTIYEMSRFPFWPQEGVREMDTLVFWSENHLFMTLGAAYLYHQYRNPDLTSAQLQEKFIECRLLMKYLDLHCHEHFKGTYEVCSHVYLPFSMAALLNIYDFAKDPDIKEKAKQVLDIIVWQLMLITDPIKGVGNLSASARTYFRFRQRNHGHNINQLINLMTGDVSQDTSGASALLSFLILTSWRPSEKHFDALYHDYAESVRLSHSLDAFTSLHNTAENHEDDECTPFYWAAGLVVHPLYSHKTRHYQQKYCLTHNAHLWPLNAFFFTSGMLVRNMRHYCHFSEGQAYTDITLNVYKRAQRSLIMSSFEMFSPHRAAYQQLSWMINLAGVPVWSQSGSSAESVAGWGILNTHNPAVQQRKDVLVATYIAPSILTSTLIVGNVFSYKVRFFWPLPFFNETKHYVVFYQETFAHSQATLNGRSKSLQQRNQGMFDGLFGKAGKVSPEDTLLANNKHDWIWLVAQREGCYVAVLCTRPCVIDRSSDCKDAQIQPFRDQPKVSIPRITCSSKKQSWVVVVGTTETYATINEFVDVRLQQILIEEKRHPTYKIVVLDQQTAEPISYEFDLHKEERVVP